MELVDAVLNDPLGVLAITLVVVFAWYYQRGLSWERYQRYHRLKVRLAPRLARYWPTVKRVGYRNHSPEYVTTIDKPPREVFSTLIENGGSPHLINSLKYRIPDGEASGEYMAASVVFPVGNQEQAEAYLFNTGYGSTDVYSHVETSVLDVDDHLQDGGVPGDPRYIVRDALGVSGSSKGE